MKVTGAFAITPVLAALSIGLASCVVFLWQWLIAPPGSIVTLGLFIAVAGVFGWFDADLRHRLRATTTVFGRLSLLVLVAAAFDGFYVVRRAANVPEGVVDAWGMWNLHARFLFRDGGSQWRQMFDAAMFWNHNDYPLLLPTLVSAGWRIVGSDTPVVPIAVAIGFCGLTVWLVWAAVTCLADERHGVFAALVLLATPSFLLQTAAQIADIPLAVYVLCAVVLLRCAEEWPAERALLHVLVGVAAGFAGWTKNEGLVLVVAVVLTHAALFRRRRAAKAHGFPIYRRELGSLCVGLAPTLLLIVAFKIFLAPPGDLRLDWAALQRMTVLSRYPRIAQSAAVQLAMFGDATGGVPPLVLVVLFVLTHLARGASFRFLELMLVPLVMLFAEFVVFAMTPYEPAWHVHSALARLLLQVWPACVTVLTTSPRDQFAHATVAEAGI